MNYDSYTAGKKILDFVGIPQREAPQATSNKLGPDQVGKDLGGWSSEVNVSLQAPKHPARMLGGGYEGRVSKTHKLIQGMVE